MKRGTQERLERLPVQESARGAGMAAQRLADYYCHQLLRGRKTENNVGESNALVLSIKYCNY